MSYLYSFHEVTDFNKLLGQQLHKLIIRSFSLLDGLWPECRSKQTDLLVFLSNNPLNAEGFLSEESPITLMPECF